MLELPGALLTLVAWLLFAGRERRGARRAARAAAAAHIFQK
jgi:hypothetical protein